VLTKQEFMLLMVGGVFVLEALSVMLQVSGFQNDEEYQRRGAARFLR